MDLCPGKGMEHHPHTPRPTPRAPHTGRRRDTLSFKLGATVATECRGGAHSRNTTTQGVGSGKRYIVVCSSASTSWQPIACHFPPRCCGDKTVAASPEGRRRKPKPKSISLGSPSQLPLRSVESPVSNALTKIRQSRVVICGAPRLASCTIPRE